MLLIRFNSVKERLGEALHKEMYVSPLQILPIPKIAARKNKKKAEEKEHHQGC